MSQDKIKITIEHVLAIHEVIIKFGEQKELAKFLGVTGSNISLWARGKQVIPLRHADKICKKYPEFTMLYLRPDIEIYRRFFKLG